MNPSSLSLKACNLCPRNCLVNRNNKYGYCQKGEKIEISWFGPHFGEEPPISGSKGSGTVFFNGCNLSCVYCQNWQISQGKIKIKKITTDKAAEIFLDLQKRGCHNINLVSPTIWTLQLIEVIKKAKNKGLKIPIVWNSNAYETVPALKKLQGLVDIYLPDYKYAADYLSIKYSNTPDYSYVSQKAILEMFRQVGDLNINKEGIATKGIIIRHLLLPGLTKNSIKCLNFIRQISPNIHLSLMSQYNPVYKAIKVKELNHKISKEEYQKVRSIVDKLCFRNGWFQEYDSQDYFNPDFSKANPFGGSC